MGLQLIGEEPTTESVIPSGCQTREQAASATADARSRKASEQQNPRVRRRNNTAQTDVRNKERRCGASGL